LISIGVAASARIRDDATPSPERVKVIVRMLARQAAREWIEQANLPTARHVDERNPV
jgi:hypothetical protein